MKSSFSRSFCITAAILLIAMTILGASFQMQVNQYLTNQTVSNLQKNADAIADLASAYSRNGGLSNRAFQLNLTVASRVSGADAVVCDSDIPVGKLSDCILANGGQYLKGCDIFDVYTGHHIAQGKKSVAFSLTMRAEDQTLTDDHAEETVKAELDALKTAFGAVMR